MIRTTTQRNEARFVFACLSWMAFESSVLCGFFCNTEYTEAIIGMHWKGFFDDGEGREGEAEVFTALWDKGL